MLTSKQCHNCGLVFVEDPDHQGEYQRSVDWYTNQCPRCASKNNTVINPAEENEE
jgi:Zn finger protein HypA/HybF involved in hydrogenase expression